MVRTALGLLAAGLSLFHLWTAWRGVLSALEQRGLHLFVLLALAFLVYNPSGKRRDEHEGIPLYDLLLWGGILAAGTYFFLSVKPEAVLERGVWGATPFEVWFGVGVVLLVLEATRRTVGWPLVIVALLFLGYALLGPYLPGALNHKGFTVEDLSNALFWSTEGLFTIPIRACATFVIIFILFGTFLELFGGGRFFIDLAYSLTGRVRGGPALTAVVASGFMGMISGSAISNVVTTGAFTIPLMRRVGYRPLFAGAVEAVASTGGQFTPPVMGVAAFVMADMTDIPYWKIALSAFIPALLFYISVGTMVYLEAARSGLKGMAKEELPSFWRVLMRGAPFLAVIFILVYFLLVKRYEVTKVGLYTVLATIAIGSLNVLVTERRLPWREVLEGLRKGAVTMIPVSVASATAGLIIGVVSLTGLGVMASKVIIGLAGGKLIPTLVLSMIACIILGMGVPTTPAYIITAILTAPVITKIGVPLLAAHLFVLYFSVLSFITPPVALSAYAASALSGANAMKTGFEAWRLGLAGFIVPFMYIFSPALLLKAPPGVVVLKTLTALLVVVSLAIALKGWFMGPLPVVMRAAILLSLVPLIKLGGARALAGGAVIMGILALEAIRGYRRWGGKTT